MNWLNELKGSELNCHHLKSPECEETGLAMRARAGLNQGAEPRENLEEDSTLTSSLLRA